jgi:homogentisate 1,2-dioxygenase
MIHRLQRGIVPPKPHTVFRPEGNGLAFEHCFTRQGFEGAYTIMYHRKPPHWIEGERMIGPHPGIAPLEWDGAMRRRHFRAADMAVGGSPFMGRQLFLGNSDIGMWIARPTESDPTLCVNADADELTFVFQGKGRLDSPLGTVPFKEGDYVYVPRGLPHRFVLAQPSFFFIMEGKPFIDLPAQFRSHAGQIKMDAPYSHRDFVAPEWPEAGVSSLGAPLTVRTLRLGHVTEHVLMNDPFDLYGWDGQVWPFAFPILAYQPKTGLVHLPPTTHITFAGQGFVICSFVPRKTDFHPEAVPCPYPHSSPSCDEVLFYVSGNFTSRKGIGPGSVSLHPTGVTHGPHPGTYEASVGTDRTSELAVMVDTFQPLLPTKMARSLEDPEYNRSWALIT